MNKIPFEKELLAARLLGAGTDKFRIEEEFLFYDVPWIFTIRNEDKLFYFQAISYGKINDFFAREITKEELDLLKENKIELRKLLLESNPLYLIEESDEADGSKIEASIIDPNDYAEEFPKEGVFLYA